MWRSERPHSLGQRLGEKPRERSGWLGNRSHIQAATWGVSEAGRRLLLAQRRAARCRAGATSLAASAREEGAPSPGKRRMELPVARRA